MALLFSWKSPKHMRRGLPNRQMVLLEKFYEDYMHAMYGPPPEEEQTDDQAIGEAPWESETIIGGPT